MKTIRLRDKSRIEAFLRRDALLHLYGLGDLDDYHWPHTTWRALVEGDDIRAIALLYTAFDPPILLAFADGGDLSAAQELLDSITPELPPRIYCHLSPGLAEALEPTYRLESHGDHLKMALAESRALDELDAANVAPLTPADADQLVAFYEAHYPGNFFEPAMLAMGNCFGLRDSAGLVSVAGVHVCSPTYKVASLGNIATRLDSRGMGFAAMVTGALCRSLREAIDHIGANVKADNTPAVRCYKKLGFRTHAQYIEYMAERA